jgi:hypothetical protein
VKAWAALVLVPTVLLACDPDRRDAETVLNAVRRFRVADHAATPAAVEALKATPCSAPDACQTRDTCVAVGEATSRALQLKAEVEKALAAIEAGTLAKDTPEARELPKKLDEAETLLKKGHEGLATCDELALALKRKHRL